MNVDQMTDTTSDPDDELTEFERGLSGMTSEEIESLYDQYQSENEHDIYQFDCILDHTFKEGVLLFKVRYLGDGGLGKHILEIPFPVLKSSIPLDVSRYIRDKVIEKRRKGHYSSWASQTFTNHNQRIRRWCQTDKISQFKEHLRRK
jgi:hypothetical protein